MVQDQKHIKKAPCQQLYSFESQFQPMWSMADHIPNYFIGSYKSVSAEVMSALSYEHKVAQGLYPQSGYHG